MLDFKKFLITLNFLRAPITDFASLQVTGQPSVLYYAATIFKVRHSRSVANRTKRIVRFVYS